MPHSRKPSTATGDHIELITYLRRKPGLTRAQFNTHWQSVHAKKIAPWAEKHGVISYKQIHTHGTIIPNNTGAPLTSTDADPITANDLIQPVKFDGIAVYEITSLQAFESAMGDEYYKTTIANDEKVFMDTEGLGGGVVARFYGRVWSVVEKGKNVLPKHGNGDLVEVGSGEMDVWSRLSRRSDLISMQDERPLF